MSRPASGTKPWQLRVLGGATLDGPGRAAWFLERKLAACLAYLTLEGGTPRSRLAGLLWPESPEATARNNPSQMLRKLRLTTGAELITGTDALSLHPELEVDAVQARGAVTQGRLPELLRLEGDLLDHLGDDDCPDLGDWWTAERERLLEWRAQARRHEAARLEGAGDYEAALAHAQGLLDLDPVSEDAWRRLMRPHCLRGDRAAARDGGAGPRDRPGHGGGGCSQWPGGVAAGGAAPPRAGGPRARVGAHGTGLGGRPVDLHHRGTRLGQDQAGL